MRIPVLRNERGDETGWHRGRLPPEGITVCARARPLQTRRATTFPPQMQKRESIIRRGSKCNETTLAWPEQTTTTTVARTDQQQKKKKKKLLRKTECGRIPSSTDTDLVSWMWNVDLWELRGERAKMVGISRRTSNWHTTLGSSRTSSSSSTFYRVVVVGDNLLGLKDDGRFIVTPFVWTV